MNVLIEEKVGEYFFIWKQDLGEEELLPNCLRCPNYYLEWFFVEEESGLILYKKRKNKYIKWKPQAKNIPERTADRIVLLLSRFDLHYIIEVWQPQWLSKFTMSFKLK